MTPSFLTISPRGATSGSRRGGGGSGTDAPPAGFPVYNPATDILHVNEGFDEPGATPQTFYDARLGADGNVNDWRIASASPQTGCSDCLAADGVFITGRDGTGNAWQFTYDVVAAAAGGFQPNHYLAVYGYINEITGPTLCDGFSATQGLLVTQCWRRWDQPGPLSNLGAYALKWLMMFQRAPDGYSSRIQVDTQDHSADPPVYPANTQWCVLESFQIAGGHQQLSPYFDDLRNAGWWQETVCYQPNSSVGAQDGIVRQWIMAPGLGINTPKMILNISYAGLGVVPPGSAGGLPWTNSAFLDTVGLWNDGSRTLQYVGIVRWFDILAVWPADAVNFTVAIDDIKIWTTARIPKGS